MSFFIQVSSKDCLRYFPENRSDLFQIKLPGQVDGNNYEVGLVNICFANTKPLLLNDTDRSISLYFNGDLHKLLIPCQTFCSITEFVDCLSEIVSDYTESIKIEITSDGKVLIKTIDSEFTFSDKIACILGMETNVVSDTFKYGTFSPSHDNIDRMIHVCLDEAASSLSGNGNISFLQTIYPSNINSNVNLRFSPTLYIPLKNHRFETLHFSLCDSTGKEVLLKKSVTQALLHFRQKDEPRIH